MELNSKIQTEIPLKIFLERALINYVAKFILISHSLFAAKTKMNIGLIKVT